MRAYAVDNFCNPADSLAAGVGISRSRLVDPFIAGNRLDCGDCESDDWPEGCVSSSLAHERAPAARRRQANDGKNAWNR